MRRLQGLGKAIATVGACAILLLAIFVNVGVVAACQTGDSDRPGLVSAVSNAAEAAHAGVTHQLDKLDWAIGNVLVQLESACMRGYAY